MDNNVNNEDMCNVCIYQEMFPKVDREVVKIVVSENSDSQIIDILLNLSVDPCLQDLERHKNLYTEEIYKNNDQEEWVTCYTARTSDHEILDYLEKSRNNETEETNEFTNLCKDTEYKNSNKSRGLFKRIFSKKEKESGYYSPDDQL